jgi:hypothetical protein
MLIQPSEIRVIREAEEKPHHKSATASGDARAVIGTKGSLLQDLVGDIDHDQHIHIPSRGAWSMHDVLEFILQRTGPDDVWITSWTITERPMRLILELLKNGTIRKLRALFSERVEAMNPVAHQVASMNMDVRLTKIHAKCIVVLNEHWGVSVSGSANFTRNPRIEKYVICTHRSIAESERLWIDAEMEGAHPFNDHE